MPRVRSAKPRPKSYKLVDTNRLFLLVTPSGGKLWRWNYYYDAKQKSMAFGAYPSVSLADARAKRDEAQCALAEGHDPSVAKKLKIGGQPRGRPADVREDRPPSGHENARAQWAKIHASDIIRSLERDVFPDDWRSPDRPAHAAA